MQQQQQERAAAMQAQMPQSPQMFSQQEPIMVPQIPQMSQDVAMMAQMPQIQQDPNVNVVTQMQQIPQAENSMLASPSISTIGVDGSSTAPTALAQRSWKSGGVEPSLPATAFLHISNTDLFGSGEILPSQRARHSPGALGLERRTAA